MPLNKKILLKVRDHILEDPRRLQMGDWLNTGLTPGTEFYGDILQLVPDCGTIGCIAGWISFFYPEDDTEYYHYTRGHAERAIEAIGINKDSEIRFRGIASDLFYVDQWQEINEKAYEVALANKDIKGMAHAAAAQIDWFIAEYGEEE